MPSSREEEQDTLLSLDDVGPTYIEIKEIPLVLF